MRGLALTTFWERLEEAQAKPNVDEFSGTFQAPTECSKREPTHTILAQIFSLYPTVVEFLRYLNFEFSMPRSGFVHLTMFGSRQVNIQA